MAEQAEQGKTKAELFRPLCAQGPYPPGKLVGFCVLRDAILELAELRSASARACRERAVKKAPPYL